MPPRKRSLPLTYRRYLGLDRILSAQKCVARPAAHDELQFIVVHQVYELWFKLLIFETEAASAAMRADEPKQATWIFVRLIEILRVLGQQIMVLETMTPVDFLKFRSNLDPASGFQSSQFRELEFMSGLKDERYVRAFRGDARATKALKRRLAEPTLWDAFTELLRRRGLPARSPAEIIESVVACSSADEYYDVNRLAETMVEYDEMFAAWRHRHAQMAERMIGAKPGTGRADVSRTIGEGESFAEAGVRYLQEAAKKRFFPLLWEARTHMK